MKTKTNKRRCRQGENRAVPAVDRFVRDIKAVCKKHNLSVGPDDGHTAMMVVRFSPYLNSLLCKAVWDDRNYVEHHPWGSHLPEDELREIEKHQSSPVDYSRISVVSPSTM